MRYCIHIAEICVIYLVVCSEEQDISYMHMSFWTKEVLILLIKRLREM